MQKTAYEMRISDWSSDVCSSDLKHTRNLSDCSKPLIQIINDHLGLIHPGGLAILFDAQARHFDLAALLQQRLAILLVVFGIPQGHRYVEATQGAAGLHAERAGGELIEGRAAGGLIDLRIGFGGTLRLDGVGARKNVV